MVDQIRYHIFRVLLFDNIHLRVVLLLCVANIRLSMFLLTSVIHQFQFQLQTASRVFDVALEVDPVVLKVQNEAHALV